MNSHLILVSWTWFPQGWWTLSCGKLQKALGRTAQVRPSLSLLWEEPMSGCGSGRGADVAKPLRLCVWRVGVQFTVYSNTPIPFILWRESTSRLLKAAPLCFAVKHRGFKAVLLIPGGKSAPLFGWLKSSGVICHLRTSRGWVRGWKKYEMAWPCRRRNIFKTEPLISLFYGIYSPSETFIIPLTELNSRPMTHHLITCSKSYPIMWLVLCYPSIAICVLIKL